MNSTWLPQNVADGVKRVMVAIGPGKNDDSKFHAVAAPVALRNPILAHSDHRHLPAALSNFHKT